MTHVYIIYLKSGIPLGVLIPAPAMMIIFLHLSSFMRFTRSSTEFIAEELNARTWLDFDFLGDVLLDRDCGGFGVIESFLNDETNPLSDLFVAKVLVLCLMGRLRGLTVRSDPLFEDFRTGDFLGDTLGRL